MVDPLWVPHPDAPPGYVTLFYDSPQFPATFKVVFSPQVDGGSLLAFQPKFEAPAGTRITWWVYDGSLFDLDLDTTHGLEYRDQRLLAKDNDGALYQVTEIVGEDNVRQRVDQNGLVQTDTWIGGDTEDSHFTDAVLMLRFRGDDNSDQPAPRSLSTQVVNLPMIELGGGPGSWPQQLSEPPRGIPPVGTAAAYPKGQLALSVSRHFRGVAFSVASPPLNAQGDMKWISRTPIRVQAYGERVDTRWWRSLAENVGIPTSIGFLAWLVRLAWKSSYRSRRVSTSG